MPFFCCHFAAACVLVYSAIPNFLIFLYHNSFIQQAQIIAHLLRTLLWSLQATQPLTSGGQWCIFTVYISGNYLCPAQGHIMSLSCPVVYHLHFYLMFPMTI